MGDVTTVPRLINRDDVRIGTDLTIGLNIVGQTVRALGYCPPASQSLMNGVWWTVEAENVAAACVRERLEWLRLKRQRRQLWRVLDPRDMAEHAQLYPHELLARDRGEGEPCPR